MPSDTLKNESTFPNEEPKRGHSRGGHRELPAPHFQQAPYVKDTGERLEMERKNVPTKSGDFKFQPPVTLDGSV